ncbi:MAG: diaminopropionate ammonia-lyase [Pseudomonadota bacterium]
MRKKQTMIASLFSTSRLHHLYISNELTSTCEHILSRKNFDDAYFEIITWDHYQKTPLYQLQALAKKLNVSNIYYKDESERFNLKSFKALGGAYAALRQLQKLLTQQLKKPVSTSDIAKGLYKKECHDIILCSATDGNHGRSLAWGAARYGAKCVIFIHRDVSQYRAQAIEKYGAQIIRIDGDYDDSVEETREWAKKNNGIIISDTSWPGYSDPPKDVMSGYGVMIDELQDQISSPPTHVFVQGGVGGLPAGVFARLKQHYPDTSMRLIVVEPALAQCLFVSAQKNQASTFHIREESCMAGLSCGETSPIAWDIIKETASDFITIDEELVAPSLRLLENPLAHDPVIVAGESAIAGFAAFVSACQQSSMRDALALCANSKILLIGSEGNTDPETRTQILKTS